MSCLMPIKIITVLKDGFWIVIIIVQQSHFIKLVENRLYLIKFSSLSSLFKLRPSFKKKTH